VTSLFAATIAELEEAIRKLTPPFLALPEDGHTPESLAYARGARDAYQTVVDALKDCEKGLTRQ
jgi:hypothetical protein